MGISVSTSKQQVTASVTDDAVSATVSAGFGATGPQGPTGPAGSGGVTSFNTLTGAVTFAVVGGTLATAGNTITLTVVGGTGAVSSVAGRTGDVVLAVADVTGLQAALDGKAAASHTHALSSLTQSGATAGQVVAWDGSAWAAATPTTYTLPNATASTLGGVIVGSGLSVSSGTVSANVTSVAGRTGAVTIAAADVSGLGGAATLNVGNAAGTVAAGDHTHSQLHDRSHAITSSSDHTATAWRVFYSNGSGVVTELSLGSAGQALLSNGASAAPSWGSAGSNSASDLTTGTLGFQRLPARVRASANLYLWSSFR